MAKQPETKVKFSIFNKEFTDGMREMGRESTTLRKEFKLQESQLKENGSETDILTNKLNFLSKEQEIAKQRVKATADQLSKAKTYYGENSEEARKLADRLLDLKTKEQNLANDIVKTSRKLSDQEQDMAITKRAAEKLGTALSEVGEKAKDVSSKVGEIALPTLGAGAGGVAVAMDIDSAVRNLASSIGATGEEARILEEDMRAVWESGFGESPDQVAEAMQHVKTNIDDVGNGTAFQDLTKDVITLAKITDSDLTEATRGIDQLMHNFGLTSSEALDLFAKGQQNGLNYSQEMFDNISEYAPLFQNAGFSAEEYFTLLSNGVENGAYNLDFINDSVKEFGIRIADGSKTTSDAMGEMSSSTQKVWKDFNNGKATVKDVMNAVLPELEGMDDQVEANQIGVDLFGTKWEDMGSKTMYSLDDVNNSMKNVDGTMKTMTDSQEQSFGTKFQETLRTLGVTLEPIGLMILDMINKVMPHLKKFSDWFVGLSPVIHQAMAIFGVIGAILTPVITVLGFVANAIGNVISVAIKIYNWLSKLKWLWTALRTVMLALSGPIGLIIGVIMLLIGVFALLWQKNEGFRNGVIKIWNSITNFFTVTLGELWNKFIKWGTDLVTSIPAKFEEIRKGMSDKWKAAMKFLSDSASNIKQTFINWGVSIATYIVNKFQSIKQGVIDKFNGLKNGVVNAASNTYNGIRDKFDSMKNKVMSIASSIGTSVRNKFNEAKNFIINPIQSAKDKVQSIISKIKGFFSSLKLKIPTPSMPKLPHFSLKTGSKTVFGKTISYPTGLDVSWYKTGGVFTDPVVAGNAGFGDVSEAIVPFEGKHASRIANLIATEQKKLSNSVAQKAESVINQVINLTVVSELDGYEVARSTYNHVDELIGNKTSLNSFMKGVR